MRQPIIGAALFAGMINLLALSGPLFMLEVYDRVLPSRSVPTLVALMLLVGSIYLFSGFLDVIRGRVMTRVAALVDAALSRRVFSIIAGTPLRGRIQGDALKPAQEMDQIRIFLAGPGPTALFDLPWTPLYLLLCFLLHPLIGWLTASGMIILLALTILTDLNTRALTKEAALAVMKRNRLGEAAYRNAETLCALGMTARASDLWESAHSNYATLQRQATDISSALAAMSRALRYMIQSCTLGLGAYLVIQGDMSGGTIVAASVIATRALAPAEQVIANWRGLLAARQSWQRLQELLIRFPDEPVRTHLPAPTRSLAVEGVSVIPPGEQRTTVQSVSFKASAGTVIGVIGPSASGKSSLVRTIVGVWTPARGQIRLDGAALDQWSQSERGRYIGYMPQNVDLFPGTVAENIARLDPAANDEAIVEAATRAGVHDLIVNLPNGYETEVADGGTNLSAGQRQRLALARALYGNPFLVVLDEPNSNLDEDGDLALAQAIQGVRMRGGIVIVVAHRTNVLALLDCILVMGGGVAKAFGPRDSVLATLTQRKQNARSAGPSLTIVDSEGA